MSGTLLIAALAATCALLVIAMVLATCGARGKALPEIKAGSQWRAALLVRLLFLLLGISVAIQLAQSSSSRYLMIAPAVVGLALMAGVLVSELVIKAPVEPGLRTARLEQRSIRSYIAPQSVKLVGALLVIHIAVMAFTTLIAIPDDLGRPGRAIGFVHEFGASWSTPFPGSYYTSWQFLMVLLLTAVAALSLFQVVRRPRGFAHDERSEDALRLSSAATVVGAFGASIALSHVGIAGIAAMQLLSESTTEASGDNYVITAPGWFLPAGIAILLTAIFALLVGIKLGVAALVPNREVKQRDREAA